MVLGKNQEARGHVAQYLLRTSFIINLGWKVTGGEGSVCLWAKNLSISHQFMTEGRNVFSAMKEQPMRSLALASTNQRPLLRSRDYSRPIRSRVADRMRATSENFCLILWEPEQPGEIVIEAPWCRCKNTFVSHLLLPNSYYLVQRGRSF